MIAQTNVIVASKAGRLGNRLFLSAYFMANALALGYRVWNPALGEYAASFLGSSRDPWCRFPCVDRGLDPELADQCRDMIMSILPRIVRFSPPQRFLDIIRMYDKCDSVYDLNGGDFHRRLSSGGFLFVRGWKFRDHEHLVTAHGAIRKYFTPVRDIRVRAEKCVEIARSRGDFLIGIHVRQGDYRHWKGGVHYFETDQYCHWMREVSCLQPNRKIVFLVCASGPIDFGKFAGIESKTGPGDAVADLHALSLCDAIMGPPSTFSTWASYVGRVPLCMLRHDRQQITLADFVMHDRV